MVSLFLAWSCFFGDTVGCFCLGWNISGLVRKRVWGRTTVKCVGRIYSYRQLQALSVPALLQDYRVTGCIALRNQ